MYDALAYLLALGALTSSGNGSAFDTKVGLPRQPANVQVRVTAVSGTSPTAIFKVQHSDDGSTWTDHAICDTASVTAVGVYNIPVSSDKRYLRVAYTLGGTSPSFTTEARLNFSKP